MRFIALFCGFVFLVSSSFAESYTLTYQKENRWVAQKDKEPLRALLQTSKKNKTFHFMVTLPKEKRPLSIERLNILRDILLGSLNVPHLIIEEVPGTTPHNTLLITFISTDSN